MSSSNASRGLGRDRLLAAAFVVLVSTAIVGFSTAETGATFTGSTTNPGGSWNTATVQPPTAITATSAAAGKITLTWAASTSTVTGTQVLTYDVYRGPVGGPYATLVGSTTATTLTISDTPSSDGSYGYVVQTRIAQGAGGFTGAAAAVTGTSDRTAPTMSATCNGGSCAGWFNASVSFVVTGNDGAGVGMGTATTNLDGAGALTSAAPRTITVSGQSAAHTVVYSGADAVGNASADASQTVKIDLTAPTAAGGLTAADGPANGEADLTWTAGTDALSGVAGYSLRRSTGATCPAPTAANYPVVTALGNVLTTTQTGLVAGTSYCWYIQTQDAAGNLSAPSAPAGPYTAQ